MMPFYNDAFGENMFTQVMKMDYEGKPKIFLEMMKFMSLMPLEKFIATFQDLPLYAVLETNNVHIVSFLENAMVPAISDRGLAIPVVFAQAENTITYAQSPQNRYNDDIQKQLHGEEKKSGFIVGSMGRTLYTNETYSE